ncbi:hypothetical protein SEA_RAYMOND7_27 [Mycobacterium phage Raymond7]|uniref:Minor tail protein n=1 Tax=Mycobacterium phage Raymond7 TaxID=2743931 RepID=A0AA48V695_9CAUD|nr:minor tail protein [Mycobacterium phage Raymond7]QKY79206.1 hypothetical protein SEA_RAYMOND7_27 [Mycobacterium phage Raymond7]
MIDTLHSAVDVAAELYEPDDTIGLLGLVVANGGSIIAAIGTIVVGVITVRGQRKGRDRWSHDRETLREIHEETVNSHRGKSNMREDLDELRDLVANGFKRIERDIGGIREEIRTERKERIAGDRRRCDSGQQG